MSSMTINTDFEMTPGLKWALAISGMLHLAVLIGGAFGLPYLKKDIPLPPQSVSVEIVQADPSSTKSAAKKTNKKVIADKPKEDKPVAPPKVDLKEPPKLIPEEPKEIVKEKAAEPEPKTPPPPSESLKPPVKPKPKKPPENKPAQQQDDFASLLKNLQDSESQATQTETPEEQDPEKVPSIQDRFKALQAAGEKAEIQQMIKNQYGRCWRTQIGAKYAEDLIVNIRVFLNPDASYRDATYIDTLRFNTDRVYRAAAESAMRAVTSPMCQRLDVPLDKYDIWNELEVEFNPREMLQ